MGEQRLYFVIGGVFADGSLTRLEDGARLESFGPFADEATARQVATEQKRRFVDICWHHLYVTSSPMMKV